MNTQHTTFIFIHRKPYVHRETFWQPDQHTYLLIKTVSDENEKEIPFRCIIGHGFRRCKNVLLPVENILFGLYTAETKNYC